MAITDPLVLPEDVVLVPVAELPEEVRGRLGCEEGDFAITRPRLRVPSRILDPDSARLLGEFRSPTTVAEAVIRFSRERGSDPEAVLTEAYPLLDRLFGSGFLVAEGSAESEAIEPTLAPGEEIAGFRDLECIQVLDDTELHQVRREADGRVAALKLERTPGVTQGALEREAAVLAHLDGAVSPRLLGAGATETGGRRYVVTEWISGVEATVAAAELRQDESREGLRALACAVARAYAHLHELGVLHGDVHPRNVLVTAAGQAVLLDFGYARWRDDPREPERAGIGFFFEPEYAAAVLAVESAPRVLPAGEQYAVAALLYLLITGAHYRDFSLGRDEMLRQIAGEPPLPFVARGVEPWPAMEAVLARALAKNPDERFPSLAALADALAAVPAEGDDRRPSGSSRAEALLVRFTRQAGLDGDLFLAPLPPPRASVKGGAAGIACALYRVALAREDAGLLSLADVWTEKAAREEGDEAYFNRDGDRGSSGILPEVVGPVSLYHSPTGTHCVQALIAHVLGNPAAQHQALRQFLEVARQPCLNPDLALGRSGVLLAAALLVDTLEGKPPADLLALGDEILAGLWEEIGALPPIPECAGRFHGWANLGMAHGWAGSLYATLQWSRAASRPLPPGMTERLAELAGCARPRGRGLCWPWRGENGEDHGTMAGWCNGSAGFVFLWTLAERQLGDPAYRPLAEGAAWNAWEDFGGPANLCCGFAGRAYALLNFYKAGGGEEWLTRARDLAERSALAFEQGGTETLRGLFWGEAGAAALAADLIRPEGAAFPCFEDEGW